MDDLRNRLDHLVEAVSNIEGSLRTLQTQVGSRSQSRNSPGAMSTSSNSPQPLISAGRDNLSEHNTPRSSSSRANSDAGNPRLPPHIAAAVQILATYIRTDYDGANGSRQSSSVPNQTSAQQDPLQSLAYLSTSNAGNNALAALFTQPGNFGAVSSFANVMGDSGAPVQAFPFQDDLSLHGHNHSSSSSQDLSTMSLSELQNVLSDQRPGRGLAGSPGSDNFMSQHQAFFAGIQDPSAMYQQQQAGNMDFQLSNMYSS